MKLRHDVRVLGGPCINSPRDGVVVRESGPSSNHRKSFADRSIFTEGMADPESSAFGAQDGSQVLSPSS